MDKFWGWKFIHLYKTHLFSQFQRKKLEIIYCQDYLSIFLKLHRFTYVFLLECWLSVFHLGICWELFLGTEGRMVSFRFVFRSLWTYFSLNTLTFLADLISYGLLQISLPYESLWSGSFFRFWVFWFLVEYISRLSCKALFCLNHRDLSKLSRPWFLYFVISSFDKMFLNVKWWRTNKTNEWFFIQIIR